MCAWEYSSPQSQLKGEVLVGVPYKQNFSAKFLTGIVSMQFPDYFAHSIYLQTGQPLDISRNIMVSNGLQRNVSHLFFVDEDIVLQRDTLLQLKENNMPIIGATYFGRNPPYNVVANINRNPLTRDDIVSRRNGAPDGKAVMEVHEVGMGATLIDMRVFQRIAQVHDLKWYCMLRHPDIPEVAEAEKDDTGIMYTTYDAAALGYRCKYCNNTLIANFFDYRIGKNHEDSLSEDYYFCKLARQAGFSIYLSLHTEVEHEITMFTIGSGGLTNSTVTAGLA